MQPAIVSPRRFALLVAMALLGHATALRAMETIWQADILFHVNTARATHNLAPLRWNDRLGSAASAHAADLQDCRKLQHQGCDGNTLPQRAGRAGYAFRRLSENLALCPCDAAGVVQLWLLSEGHRRNLLDANITEMGADTRADAADLRRQQWVLVLGRE